MLHDLAMVMGSGASTIRSVVRFGRIRGFGDRRRSSAEGTIRSLYQAIIA